MKFTKPDGTIKVEGSGCCCPPGTQRYGHHTNAATSWWRTTGTDWTKCRSQSKATATALSSKSCAEFVQAMGDAT